MTDDYGHNRVNEILAREDRVVDPSAPPSVRIQAKEDGFVAEFSCGCVMHYWGLPEGSCSCGMFTFERLKPPEFDLEIEYDRYGALRFVKRVPIEYKPLPPKRRHRR